jgi:hypothetical protein
MSDQFQLPELSNGIVLISCKETPHSLTQRGASKKVLTTSGRHRGRRALAEILGVTSATYGYGHSRDRKFSHPQGAAIRDTYDTANANKTSRFGAIARTATTTPSSDSPFAATAMTMSTTYCSRGMLQSCCGASQFVCAAD